MSQDQQVIVVLIGIIIILAALIAFHSVHRIIIACKKEVYIILVKNSEGNIIGLHHAMYLNKSKAESDCKELNKSNQDTYSVGMLGVNNCLMFT